MELPTDYLAEFGQCVPTVFTFSPGGSFKINPSPTRVLLVWWSASQAVRIFMASQLFGGTSFYLFQPNNTPLILTHAIHGPLVNMGYEMIDTGVGAVVVFAEAFMERGRDGRDTYTRRPVYQV